MGERGEDTERETMRIKSLSCRNIKNFSDYDVECGDVNVVAGKNAEGKTSVLTLVTALFGNLGSGKKGNPRILRAGADFGEISAVMVSDDRSESWNYSREFTPGKVGTPKISSSISGKIGSPVSFLQPLVDKISIEPISRAMNAPEDEQTQILLSTIPMAVDQSELATAAAGVSVPGLEAHIKNAPRMPSGLDAIEAIYKAIYDHRRDVNRDAKVKETHAKELLDGIPESAGVATYDWRARVAELERARNEVTREKDDKHAQSERQLNADNSAIATAVRDGEKQIDDDIDAQIRELEAQRSSRKAEFNTSALESYREAMSNNRQRIEAIAQQYDAKIEAAVKECAVANNHLMDQVGHDRTRAIAAQAQREATALQERSDAMTAALDRLEALKTTLLGRLDKEIRGLSVQNGVIHIKGVPLSELNTAERAKFWLTIGARRAGELGVVVADGMECLDDEQFKTVVKAMLGTGLQFFLGRVDSGNFRVERIDAPAEATA
jgi:hypothetical protein